MQLIRQATIGTTAVGKTKNTLETFPKPMLVLSTEYLGWQSVSDQSQIQVITDWQQKPTTWIPEKPITIISYTGKTRMNLDQYQVYETGLGFQLIADCNKLFDFCPFKTVVLDSGTGLNQIMLSFCSKLNLSKSKLIDPGTWGCISGKSLEIVNSLINNLSCHFVILLHESIEKDEITGEIQMLPSGFGRFREQVGINIANKFYATTTKGPDGKTKYIVKTRPFGLWKCLGARFPQDLPDEVPHSFEGIYGKVLSEVI